MPILKTFGRNPFGKELERVRASANYRNNAWQNLSETQMLLPGTSYLGMTWRFFNKPRNATPRKAVPIVRTDLGSVPKDENRVIWFGHSSYLVTVNGKNILVDPVFSGYASPFSFAGKSFKGANPYQVEDMPPIDLLILTHDHYDHLDYKTLLKLKPSTKAICASLGVGSHLRYWGFDPGIISELDWWEEMDSDGFRVVAAPARHFSGRSFTRNRTLWSSFILFAGAYRLYLGSDSGYDSHFLEIGRKYGPFDIAMLEAGQYNTSWPFIHMQPEETVRAAMDLNARVLMPVHWGKFALALHPWHEPVERVLAEAEKRKVKVTTPMIGEPVLLGGEMPASRWWETIL